MGKRGSQPDSSLLYQFDLEGNLTKTFNGIQEAVDFHKSTYSSLSAALSRSSCFGRKCYFSRSKDFKLPNKKTDANPLHSKVGSSKKGLQIKDARLFLKEEFDEEDDF